MSSEDNLQQPKNQDCTKGDNNTENVKFAYGKAIDAYNEHRRSYQAWVNLYAIFTGAFFIALYSTMAWDSDDRHWFTILISLLGLFTSICWLASVVGYYAWMKSWIEVVKTLENKLFDGEIPVYGIVLHNGKRVSDSKKERFISTQKVMQIFLFGIIIAWNVAIYLGTDCCCVKCLVIILSALSLLIIYFCSGKLFSSSLGTN